MIIRDSSNSINLAWRQSNPSQTYRRRFVLFAIAPSPGEKNGRTVGMKSNIVLKDVAVIKMILKHDIYN